MDVPKKRNKEEFMNNILDDIFHPNAPICQIISTNTEKRKDHFRHFRSQAKTRLDYDISQTDAKIDAGNTKIHYQQTEARYRGLKELQSAHSIKKHRYFSGGPPQWKFINEIWMRKQSDLQKEYGKRFERFIALRKKNERILKNMLHRKCISQVGPSWYQELSPKQIKTVDNLKHCILQDLAENTIINTQENIADLGLVLLPNHRHIEKALNNCCGCAVEFLLILYQLINPKRTRYCINDRLLLSAVVHLTMTNTLKELHIRIPSPPKPTKLSKQQLKRKKIIKYKSPYLEPFTFKKEPQKFTGIYTNKHVQRPQSPYFCYLKELKEMIKLPVLLKGSRQSLKESFKSNIKGNTKDQENEENKEMEEEHKIAQEVYTNLVDFRPVPLLLKASKYIPCINFRYEQQLNVIKDTKEVTKELEETEVGNSLCYIVDDRACCDVDSEVTEEVSDHVESTCPCERHETKDEKTICRSADRLRGGAQNTCGCVRQRSIDGLKKNRSLPDKQPGTNISRQEKFDFASARSDRSRASHQNHCKHTSDLQIYNQMYHLIRPNGGKEKKKCVCKEKHRQLIETPMCQCARCREERRMSSINYLISGLKKTDEHTDAVSVIDRVVEEKLCTCLQKYNKAVEDYEKEKREEAERLCSCRKQTENATRMPLCPCEECEEDRRKKAVVRIVAGTRETEEDLLPVIAGMSSGSPCECLKKYGKRVDEYERFKKSKKIVTEMKQKNRKFIIDGVVETTEGLQYAVSGVKSSVACICDKNTRQRELEERMETKKAHPPKGRIQYAITGIKETPERNICILENALPIEECDCMAVYQKFTEQHTTCLQLYRDYLAKMKDEYNQFIDDMLPASSSRRSSKAGEIKAISEEQRTDDEFVKYLEEEKEKEEEEDSIVKNEKCEIEPLQIKEKKNSKLVTKAKSCPYCYRTKPHVFKCSCRNVKKSSEIIQRVDSTEKKAEQEEAKVKRYFIFNKIKCNRKWQKEVLKKALNTMAEDGYPLARLPEAHKLSHFKLWMQMRCGKFWTQRDRYEYIVKSKIFWRHTNACNVRREGCPQVPLTRAEASKIDWSRAKYCRRLIEEPVEKFNRKIRQNRVSFAREFFPSTFTYEFPFKTWRDCYFAYTPSEEGDVLSKFVWHQHEYKHFADMQRFCH